MEILKYILSIIFIITIFIVMLFIWVKIMRLMKKKSFHYITPPIPENDNNWNPIDFTEYIPLIFLKDASIEYVLGKLLDIYNDEGENNKIEIIKAENWLILKFYNISYEDYINLTWILDDDDSKIEWETDENNKLDREKDDYINTKLYDYLLINSKYPKEVIGFCQHLKKPLQDYLFKIDEEDKAGENFIGTFRSEKNFGIYIPFSGLKESGNISLTRNNEINFYSELDKLPIEYIDKAMTPYVKIMKYYLEKYENVSETL